MNRIVYIYVIIIFITAFSVEVYGQGALPNRTNSKVYKEYTDSLKRTPYPWHWPVMGGKLRKLGFDLPYPNGLMVNYAYSQQELMLSDVYVGFNPNNLTPIDGIARFSRIQANVNAISVRYDFWLLPFVNFSVIGGRINADTNVDLGLPFEASFIARSQGTSLGWNTVVAGGLGPIVLNADFTQVFTWTKNTERPSKTNVIGARLGHMIRFKNRPYRNIVVLAGGQYLKLNKTSNGKTDLEKVAGISPDDKARISEQLNDWYNNLPGSEQEIFSGLYKGLNGWLTNSEGTILHYKFNKKLYYPWSMSVGFNYQHNKRYQLTSMYSFLGSRNQFTVGLTYRFGFRGKNYLHGLTL
ncbi:hypothetical protein [Carboxylicivirga taeanensis]|uniref:hypothetical protein n=1 Tax=Carboxylicivirga taeanensis TaxID=1416875 RepID=UPI003F6E0F27